MSSSSSSLPHYAPYATRKLTIIQKLSSVVDMLERALSVENMIGDDEFDASVNFYIKDLEYKTFYYLGTCYDRLEHFIVHHTRHHEPAILHKMSIDPIFLSPTTITNKPNTQRSIIPMKVFCQHYITLSSFLPAVLELTLEHNFYPFPECGGLLTGFSQPLAYTSGKTNALIEVIRENNTHLTNCLFSNFIINGSTLQASNSLDLFYHPQSRKAFNVMTQRDNTILCRAINGVHPIHHLLQKLNILGGGVTKADYRKWFGFIYHYIHVSAQHYPSESGFMFLLYNRSDPIFLAFLKKENEIFGNSICGKKAIYQIFNSLDNPTGLFHRLLLHCSPCFMTFVKYVHNKGEYYDFSSSPQSLLRCFTERQRFHREEERNDDIQILYWILTNWPASIEETQKNHK